MVKPVTADCLCAVPKVPRGLRAQRRLTGQEYWQCTRCLQLWSLRIPPNLRWQDPVWVKRGRNMAAINAKAKLAEQLAAHRQVEEDRWAVEGPKIAARLRRERADRARRYRAGDAYTTGQRLAYRARYGAWRAWLAPTVGEALERRERILRADGTARAAAASDRQNGTPGADDTGGTTMIRKAAKATVVGTVGMVALGVTFGAVAMATGMGEPRSVLPTGEYNVKSAVRDDGVVIADAWQDMSKSERKAACTSPYAGAVVLADASGMNAGATLGFLRLICN